MICASLELSFFFNIESICNSYVGNIVRETIKLVSGKTEIENT